MAILGGFAWRVCVDASGRLVTAWAAVGSLATEARGKDRKTLDGRTCSDT